MEYTKLGKTNIKLSKIGFGTWEISGDWGRHFSRKEIFDLFTTAYKLGINFFDTAPVYGNGYIEKLLGEFSINHEIIIATKIPAKEQPLSNKNIDITKYYDPNYINKVLFQSLRRLHRDYIDLLMLHNWCPQWNKTGGWVLKYLNQLKLEGKVGAIGVSLPNWMNVGLDDLINLDILDFVMVPLNLFQQWPISFISPIAQKYGFSILARSVFDHGSLTGILEQINLLPEGHVIRKKFKGKRITEAKEKIREICQKLTLDYKSLPAYAIQFCLNQPKITTVVLGMNSEKNIKDNVKNIGIKFLPSQLKMGMLFRWNRGQE